jgi:hypothetical protein
VYVAVSSHLVERDERVGVGRQPGIGARTAALSSGVDGTAIWTSVVSDDDPVKIDLARRVLVVGALGRRATRSISGRL